VNRHIESQTQVSALGPVPLGARPVHTVNRGDDSFAAHPKEREEHGVADAVNVNDVGTIAGDNIDQSQKGGGDGVERLCVHGWKNHRAHALVPLLIWVNFVTSTVDDDVMVAGGQPRVDLFSRGLGAAILGGDPADAYQGNAQLGYISQEQSPASRILSAKTFTLNSR